jgi:hypothetical protein
MWSMIASMQAVVQELAPVFTQPSFASHCQLLLAWLMCPCRRTLYHVGQFHQPEEEVARSERHPFDWLYNFFARSAWKTATLFGHLALLIVKRLAPSGPLYLLVDDTLLHKQGHSVFGVGWFRDAVASTRKRVATAKGHNWVVIALAIPVPGCQGLFIALPLAAGLHLPQPKGKKDKASCQHIARALLDDLLGYLPDREIILVGDGAYACKAMLVGLPEAIVFVGRLRGDAALYEQASKRQPKGKRGRKPKKGKRLPKPREAAAKADRVRKKDSPWAWRAVEAEWSGNKRRLLAVSYQALWYGVLGTRAIQVVVVRDPEGKLEDLYLCCTHAKPLDWVVQTYAKRWAIELLFRNSKQLLDIEGPHHFCKDSVSKLAPWVWAVHSLVILWYLQDGHLLPEADHERALMGPWDSEWSLRHMLQVFRRATLHASIPHNSPSHGHLSDWLKTLENTLLLAA